MTDVGLSTITDVSLTFAQNSKGFRWNFVVKLNVQFFVQIAEVGPIVLLYSENRVILEPAVWSQPA